MIINALWNSSVAAAPASFKDGVAAAIGILTSNFGSNLTINVHFGWGEVNGTAITAGAVGSSVSPGLFVTYDQIRTSLSAAATSEADFGSLKSLPATDPTNGGRFWVTHAQASQLNLANINQIDAYVGLNSDVAYSFDPSHRAEAGKYDGIGVLLHELTEVMGRLAWLGSYFDPNAKDVYGILDLFRYAKPGVRDTTGAGAFSADGGATLLTKFNDPSKTMGDVADWDSSLSGDSFGTSYKGVTGAMTQVDLKVMDVLGYTLTNFQGTTGKDLLFGTKFNDNLNGDAGFDTVTFTGPRQGYVITGSYPQIITSDSRANGDGQDTLTQVEVLKFTDMSLVFGLTSIQDQMVYRLYQAAFARLPDLEGFKTWATYADSSHASALELATSFTMSNEFKAKYGSDANATYINALYQNVLGRSADDAGLSFWLSKGETQAQLLADFAGSAENVQLTGSHMSNGYWVA